MIKVLPKVTSYDPRHQLFTGSFFFAASFLTDRIVGTFSTKLSVHSQTVHTLHLTSSSAAFASLVTTSSSSLYFSRIHKISKSFLKYTLLSSYNIPLDGAYKFFLRSSDKLFQLRHSSVFSLVKVALQNHLNITTPS